VRRTAQNAAAVVNALRDVGFDTPSLTPRLFTDTRSIVRFGVPPFRIEVMTAIDGVEFVSCRSRALMCDIDGVAVPVSSLADLKANQRAAGRHKDLADLEHLA
jgi:hypothetical protein